MQLVSGQCSSAVEDNMLKSGGTIKLRFSFDELIGVEMGSNEQMIHISFDKTDSRGCFRWKIAKRRKWGFFITLEDPVQRKHCIALLQGIAGAHRRLSPDGKHIVGEKTKYVGQRPLRIWVGTW